MIPLRASKTSRPFLACRHAVIFTETANQAKEALVLIPSFSFCVAALVCKTIPFK